MQCREILRKQATKLKEPFSFIYVILKGWIQSNHPRRLIFIPSMAGKVVFDAVAGKHHEFATALQNIVDEQY
jgi:hypothetical protein